MRQSLSTNSSRADTLRATTFQTKLTRPRSRISLTPPKIHHPDTTHSTPQVSSFLPSVTINPPYFQALEGLLHRWKCEGSDLGWDAGGRQESCTICAAIHVLSSYAAPRLCSSTIRFWEGLLWRLGDWARWPCGQGHGECTQLVRDLQLFSEPYYTNSIFEANFLTPP